MHFDLLIACYCRISVIAAGPSLAGALTARSSCGQYCYMWMAPPSVVGQQLALQTTDNEICCIDLYKVKF